MSDLMAKEKYPEHVKLHEVKESSQAIGEFVDWLTESKGFTLCRRDPYGELIPTNVSLELFLERNPEDDDEEDDAESD